MQKKTIEELRTSSLIMVTAKAAEGCSPCLEGYKKAALEAGATEKEIQFAISVGTRAYTNVTSLAGTGAASKAQAQPKLEMTGTVTVMQGEEKEQFLQEAFSNENVRTLDAYFRNRGFLPLETSRYVSHHEADGLTSMEAYIPYTIDEDHFSWIYYHSSDRGIDLVGGVADLTEKEKVRAGLLPPADLIKESLIVQGGAVVAGHACDLGCLWNQWLDCCGPGAIWCLTSGPDWPFCVSAFCGVCATWFCFRCGCC